MYFCVHNCTSPSNDYAAVACSSNQAQLHTHVSVPYWSPDVWLGLELLLDIQFGLPTWPEVGVAIQNFSDWTPTAYYHSWVVRKSSTLSEHCSVLWYLLLASMEHHRLPIIDACWKGDKDAVLRIISKGTEPSFVHNIFGETLLHVVCAYVLCIILHLFAL